jgi:hypothetical protein
MTYLSREVTSSSSHLLEGSSSARKPLGPSATVVMFLVLVGIASRGSVAENLDSYGDRLFERGVHIVRQGETLREITAYYLGSDELWRENHGMNPDIQNSDLIHPGQRITVLREPTKGLPSALLVQVAGRVEERPMPRPWDQAQVRDLLLERDGIRTHEDSSTRMKFPDGTSVFLTEDTLVFMRKSGAQLSSVENKSVEIVEGRADIDARFEAGDQAEVEILVAGAIATSRLDEEGVNWTRARRVEGVEGVDGSVMIYEGSGEVESAGQVVSIEKGMGTTVAEDRPPSPPEPLLQAPEPIQPSPDAVFNFANPGFEWRPVQGAASYTVELCRDAACGDLLTRESQLSASSWRATWALPVEDMFWRVTASSASGLDGFPSVAIPFSISSGGLDTTPPSGDLKVVGKQLWVAGALIVDENVKFDSSLTDTESGLGTQTAWVNGEPAPKTFWDGPWGGGEYEAKVVAADRSGNVGESSVVSFLVDADPPSLEWQVIERRGDKGIAGRHRRWVAQGVKWLEWSVDGEKWRPLVWGDSDSPIRRYIEGLHRKDLRPSDLERFEVRSSRPQVLFRAPSDEIFSNSEAFTLREDQILKVFADDLPAGVSRLNVRVKGARSEEPTLIIEATDYFGHSTSVAWSLVASN